MIPKDLIAAWKSKHGRVFVVNNRNVDYVFRALTLEEGSEFERLSAASSTPDLEEWLVKTALLYPEDFDVAGLPPSLTGFVTTLSEQIREKSGRGSVYPVLDALNQAREECQTFIGVMKSFIIATQPSYTLEDLNKMTVYDLVERTALAEEIIYVQQTTQGLDIKERTRLTIKTPEEIESEMFERLDDGIATKGDPVAQKLMAMQQGG